MSLLGEALLLQAESRLQTGPEASAAMLQEAETLLVTGYEGMDPPASDAHRKTEALARVVRLYEVWGKPDEAAQWRSELSSPQ